jgi:pyroglutamyl-peptidase
MPHSILLTSFQTWLPHHTSNSSDDLLQEIINTDVHGSSLTFLRQLPVDIPQASERVIAKIEEWQPDGIICCGMSEKRAALTVESSAIFEGTQLQTPVDLEQLLAGVTGTTISHDAGKFVCEGLYYHVLQYLQEHQHPAPCIFLHVPVLQPDNLPGILSDFHLILQNFTAQIPLACL